MPKKTLKLPSLAQVVNWEDRVVVLTCSMIMEEMMRDFIRDLSNLPERFHKPLKAASMIDFLIELEAISTDNNQKQKLRLFFEIRNRCAHNVGWKHFRECLNDDQFKEMVKFYPSKTAASDERRYLKTAVNKLSIEALNIVVKIMAVLMKDTEKKMEEVSSMAFMAGVSKGILEETKRLTEELTVLYNSGDRLKDEDIVNLPNLLFVRVRDSAKKYSDEAQEQHLGPLREELDELEAQKANRIKRPAKGRKKRRR